MFKNLKLGIKIGGGFVIVLILITVVGFLRYTGMSGVAERVADEVGDVNREVKELLETR